MAQIERETAASIAARRASEASARPASRAAARDRARGRVRGLDTPPSRTAGGPGRRKQPFPDLDRMSPADTAVLQVLDALSQAMWTQEEAILAGADGDAVHDLRVAVRRARTLLGQLRSVFPRASTKKLRDGLRFLGELSGPVRDLDILGQAVKEARPELPDTDQGALDRLVARLDAEREDARRALVEGLGSPRHARLVEAFTRFTAAPRRKDGEAATPRASRPRDDDSSAAAMPIGVIAAESIERAWKRLLRHARKIDDSSPAEDLHRVRIDGKKLRYLVEMFRSVYPDVELNPVVKSLKDLQDCLGVLNDTAVQEDTLRRLARHLDRVAGENTSAESAATLVSIGRLIERGSAHSATARRRFDDRFKDLRSKENRKRIKALVA